MLELDRKKIVIAGGSGFLGISMARHFTDTGATVSILSRSTPTVLGDWTHHRWDARTLGDWTEAIAGADVIVNLTGRTVNCVKTPDHQDEILRTDPELALYGRYVVSERLADANFEFQYPELEAAIRNVFDGK